MASSAIIPNSDIALSRDGAGDRVVVFMHGWTDDLHVWSPVITELSASGFETVRFDLAGFGDRTQANGPFTFDRFAADLAQAVWVLIAAGVRIESEAVNVERGAPMLAVTRTTPIRPCDPSGGIELHLHECSAGMLAEIVRIGGIGARENIAVTVGQASAGKLRK